MLYLGSELELVVYSATNRVVFGLGIIKLTAYATGSIITLPIVVRVCCFSVTTDITDVWSVVIVVVTKYIKKVNYLYTK